jgi:predicted MFS family arabinose efflux permease
MFGIETITAGSFITVVFLTSALITPIFGALIDKFGKIGYMMLCSLLLFALSQIIFLIYPADVNQYMTLVPLCIMGLFYATYAAIFWPCIPLIVEKNVVGTAYGVVTISFIIYIFSFFIFL